MTGQRRPKSRSLRAARAQLAEHFPQAFPLDDTAIRPLVITARDDLSAWIATQPDPAALKSLVTALQQHGSRMTYQQVVAAGGMRINLHGEPVEPVTAEGQAHAQRRIEGILAQRAWVKPRRVKVQASGSPSRSVASTPEKPPAALVKALPTVIVKKRRTVILPPK